jgi:segregation and condensation protein B
MIFILEKLMIKKEKVSKDNVVKFPSKLTDLEKQIEAVIFAAAEPLDVDTIESKVSKKSNVSKSLEKLQQEYSNRGINLVCIKDKWSFRTSPKLATLMTQEKTVEKKLSRAAVETLAIIVYHQPVTRAEIEEIRGVAFGTNTLEILMELDWVKPGGRKDVPGKPIQYLTTDGFLSHFNLQKLSDLPTVDELSVAGLIDSSSVDNAIFGSSKFFKEKQDEKKEDIYSNIDEMLNSTLDEEEKDS